MVILSYLTPLTLFVIFKGVNKHAMLFSWLVASCCMLCVLIYTKVRMARAELSLLCNLSIQLGR
jgi:hypothetical protein